jgi:TetR/AcrR family transcriptional regulator
VLTNRQEREKERKRQEIIDTAQNLFFEGGYDQTSMDTIAKNSEFSKRTVYKYFGSKEELYAAIALKSIDRMIGVFEKSIDPSANGFQKMRSIATALSDFNRNNKNYLSLVGNFVSQSLKSPTEGECISKCRSRILNFMALIEKVIEQGINDGSLRSDINPKITLSSIVNLMVGLVFMNKDIWDFMNRDNDLDYETIFDNNIELLLSSVKS